MAKKIIAANWKMNLMREEAISLFNGVKKGLSAHKETEIVVFPPSIYISDLISNHPLIEVGAQNFYFEEKGAFTGEISPFQLKNIGCNYVLIGHSERRELFDESNELLSKKMRSALDANLKIIYCCGETLQEREEGSHLEKIQSQLEILKSLTNDELNAISIAYEPIWAIGTGLTATLGQAEEMHAFIRRILIDSSSKELASEISILYGGSCNENNANELFNCPNIDGGLIGGASLKVDSFLKIVDSIK
ncbi:triose-phosphate isomerase [Crocinitomicaceae bacterium]|nr:triose-phosphate isomerase [Crocinitomicaceae bacterium]MDC1245002.1 triose-phosphate isomerase [Crocinitomicaceae bacterium]